ncbi:MAG: hypothetical protein ACLP8S_09015 [Solirubrobacteraceae bacterium]
MPAQSVQLTRVDATALISCARRTHRLSDALGARLVSELGVLRRAQTATDDPPAIVAFAQRAVTTHLPGANPPAGVVVRSLVRRLAVATNGYRLFIAPVRLRSSGKIDVAALVLTNAHDRPLGVFPALSVTPESIAQGAQYATYGFSLHSSLLAQVVPDRVASVQFDFLARPHPGSRPQARITVTVHDNVAVAMQTPPLVEPGPRRSSSATAPTPRSASRPRQAPQPAASSTRRASAPASREYTSPTQPGRQLRTPSVGIPILSAFA